MNDARPEITADGSTAAPEPANFRLSPVQGTPLTLEQRAALTELIAKEAAQFLPVHMKRLIEHNKIKPAGQPQEIDKEEEDAILDYYRSGGKKPKPANADRFLYNAESDTLTDLEREKWKANGGAEWELKEFDITADYCEAIDNLLNMAAHSAGIMYVGRSKEETGNDLPVNTQAYFEIMSMTNEIIHRTAAIICAEIGADKSEDAAQYEQLLRLQKPHRDFAIMADKLPNAIKRGESVSNFKDYSDEELKITYHFGYKINQAREPEKILVAFATDRPIEPEGLHIVELVGNYMKYFESEYPGTPCRFTAADLIRLEEARYTAKGLLDTSYSPSSDTVKQLEAELEYYSTINCMLDCTAENNARRIKQSSRHAERNIHKRYFCPLNVDINITGKNRAVKVYYPLEIPELFSYCKDKGTLKLVRAKDRAIPGLRGKQDIRGLAIDYFLAEIRLINEVDAQGKRKRRPTFRLETVYKDSGIPTPEQREDAKLKTYKQKSDRDTAIRKIAASDRRLFTKLFDQWVKTGLILGWKWRKDRQTGEYTAIEIKPNPEQDIHRKPKEAPQEA